MSTIAWDGTTLAGDTLAVIGDNLKTQVQKIFTLPDGRLFGASGDRQDVLRVRDWLAAGGDTPPVNERFAGLVIDGQGQCFRLEDALILMPMTEPFHAVGSGRDFAIAAMACWRTAAEAVALAAQFDAWTGGVIETLTLTTEKEPCDGTASRPYRIVGGESVSGCATGEPRSSDTPCPGAAGRQEW